ncbi:hypothetical protein CHISP_3150 [Chitinispirillum alkaliphilum]|nr:hypothetical protein CHISP_3150 [Chitinispirillum alkaliphilum]
MNKLTEHQIRSAVHPDLPSRYGIAVFGGLLFLFAIIVFLTIDQATEVFSILLITFLLHFVFTRTLKASLFANSVQVSDINFPEIKKITEEIKEAFSCSEEFEIFILNGTGFNTVYHKFLRSNILILGSDMVVDMLKTENRSQLIWAISRFVGALTSKQLGPVYLNALLQSVNQFALFNLITAPYERATQLTGDNLGMLATGDIEQILGVFNKFLVGTDLSEKVNITGLISQKKELQNSFFSFLARAGSTHPHLIDRHLNILAFARIAYPEEFEKFISKYERSFTLEIGRVLPRYR